MRMNLRSAVRCSKCWAMDFEPRNVLKRLRQVSDETFTGTRPSESPILFVDPRRYIDGTPRLESSGSGSHPGSLFVEHSDLSSPRGSRVKVSLRKERSGQYSLRDSALRRSRTSIQNQEVSTKEVGRESDYRRVHCASTTATIAATGSSIECAGRESIIGRVSSNKLYSSALS